MPSNYYIDPMLVSRADQLILKDLVERHLPALHQRLQEFSIDLSIVTFHWFFTLFVEIVPIEVTVRIWDCLLYHGELVIFRFAMSFLKLFEEEILDVRVVATLPS